MKQVTFKYALITDVLDFLRKVKIYSYSLNTEKSTFSCVASNEKIELAKKFNLELVEESISPT